jgi:hypothetical protein
VVEVPTRHKVTNATLTHDVAGVAVSLQYSYRVNKEYT